MISGKKILLGVTGSIAAYKAVEVLRRLKGLGAVVHVALTNHATWFISPLTFGTLSELPVLMDDQGDGDRPGIGHIDITDGLDLALVAPATANCIGKIAAGIADDAMTSALMAAACPLVIAPAMNDRMYRNPVLQRNIRFLKEQGVRFVEPETGELACGTHGCGRLASTDAILAAVHAGLSPRDLTGVTLLVTAGPTREPLDPVRYISSPSTGKMGYALAAAARARGAEVVLVSGPTQLEPPYGVTCIRAQTAAEMSREVMARLTGVQVVIMAAAVSDFRPAETAARKLKKEDAPLTMRLERTEDILLGISRAAGKRICIGFAAETDALIQNARHKLEQKNLDMIIANDLSQAGAGFGVDTNAVTIIERSGGLTELPVSPKTEIASVILDKVAKLVVKQGILP